MSSQTLGDRVKMARVARGLSQGDLERALGLKSRGYVSMLEKGTRGKAPSDETIAGLVRVLQVTREWLLNADAIPPLIGPFVMGAGARRRVEADPQYPSFALFLAEVADVDGTSAAILDMLKREAFADGADPGIAHWRDRYMTLARQLAGERKAFKAELRVLAEDDDDVIAPPRLLPERR